MERRGAPHGLHDAAEGDPTGQTHALLGLAHFHSERYGDAADCYARALAVDGAQPEWESMLAACRGNPGAEGVVPVAEVGWVVGRRARCFDLRVERTANGNGELTVFLPYRDPDDPGDGRRMQKVVTLQRHPQSEAAIP